MTKKYRFTSLSLCVTAFTVAAHANQINVTPDQFGPGIGYQTNSWMDSSYNADYTYFNLSSAEWGPVTDIGAQGSFGGDHVDHVIYGDNNPGGKGGTTGPAQHVPDGTPTLGLFGLVALGLVAMRRKFLNSGSRTLVV